MTNGINFNLVSMQGTKQELDKGNSKEFRLVNNSSIFDAFKVAESEEQGASENGIEYTQETEGNMSVDDYYKLASDVLTGKKSEDETAYNFNQDSINTELWKASDEDGNGYLDEEELDAYYKRLVTGGDDYKVTTVDEDGNEVIEEKFTEEEFKALEKLRNADKDLDTNGDGKISRDEFNASKGNHIFTEDAKENPETDIDVDFPKYPKIPGEVIIDGDFDPSLIKKEIKSIDGLTTLPVYNYVEPEIIAKPLPYYKSADDDSKQSYREL